MPLETQNYSKLQVVLYCDKSPDSLPASMRLGPPTKCQAFFGEPGRMAPAVKRQAREAGWHVEDIRILDGPNQGAYKTVVLCPHHARGRAVCEHTPKHKVWKAQDGDVAICKMTTSHLQNAIPFVGRLMTQQERKIERLKEEKAHAEGALRSIQGNITLAQIELLAQSNARAEMAKELNSRHTSPVVSVFSQGIPILGYAEDETYHHPDDLYEWCDADLEREGRY